MNGLDNECYLAVFDRQGRFVRLRLPRGMSDQDWDIAGALTTALLSASLVSA